MKGRGAAIRLPVRFHATRVVSDAAAEPPAPATVLTPERARSIVTRNRSPDLPFDRSINPYRGCEHGCVYCYARPSHAYLDLSPGLDFESRILFKTNAAELLRATLSRPDYHPRTIALGTNTDPYQPAEARLRLTRSILEVMLEYRQPVSLITRGRALLRDIDLLAELARLDLLRVAVSITTRDDKLKRLMEPRAPVYRARLRLLEALAERGIPAGVMVAPVIPALTDCDMERIVSEAAVAGASAAEYTLLRLPGEVAQLFCDWLHRHYPERAARVLNMLRSMRAGRLNDPEFGSRMRGAGIYSELIRKRFHCARRRAGLKSFAELGEPDNSRFRPPHPGGQLPLLEV